MTLLNNGNQGDSESPSRLDSVKWLFVTTLVIAGTIANFHYSQVAWAIRAAIGLVLTAGIIAIILQTAKGRMAWAFAKASRAEMRKVVWPTRQETVHTSIVVVIAVVVASLILWAIDLIFIKLISWFAG